MQKMTEQEEKLLFEKYKKEGSIEARNRLLENYLYIAQIVAKKFVGRGVDYEDLYQVGSVALVNAIERFDADRDIKFVTFATPSLIGEIKNYFRDKTRLMHISRRDSEQLLKLQEAKRTLEKDHPTPAELSEVMGVSVERVLELLEIQLATSVTSLDNVTGEGEDTQISDFVGTEEQGFAEIEQKDFLKYSLGQLEEKERKIIYERFWRRKSQKEIAEMLGVSQMYVSRAEKKILAKMRNMYHED